MNKTNIEWCDYTWNPVVGCPRGCPYCYARTSHVMRRGAYLAGKLQNMPQYAEPFEKIQFIESRLQEPGQKKRGVTVFVGSVSDIQFWPRTVTGKILTVCNDNPQHKFLFLSKHPSAYHGFKIPENCFCGLTMTCEQREQEQLDFITAHVGNRNPFISIEPLLGVLHYPLHDFTSVIVGAMTGADAVKPKKEWIKAIKRFDENVFWKNNIKKYL